VNHISLNRKWSVWAFIFPKIAIELISQLQKQKSAKAMVVSSLKLFLIAQTPRFLVVKKALL